jgi:hypothetical protein
MFQRHFRLIDERKVTSFYNAGKLIDDGENIPEYLLRRSVLNNKKLFALDGT